MWKPSENHALAAWFFGYFCVDFILFGGALTRTFLTFPFN